MRQPNKVANRKKKTTKSRRKLEHINFLALAQKLREVLGNPSAERWYTWCAIGILGITTIYWSVLGARLHLKNADALIDPFLVADPTTFHAATFPGQHTQLLKWPLFYLIRLFGFSAISYLVITVLTVLVTVAVLVLVLWRIERRPLVLGTLCLALTSVLLCIPAAPYAGALLPVNMAMLASRNIEYALFIGVLVVIARPNSYRRWQYWLATGGLTLLVVSDKFFLYVGAGAALAALVVYAIAQRWELVKLASRWFVLQLLAGVASIIFLGLLSALHLTHIINQGNGPYGIISDVHTAVLASIYAVMGIATNLGSNPVYAVTVLNDLPHALAASLQHATTVPYSINALLALGALAVAVRYVYISVIAKPSRWLQDTAANRLALLMLWATVASIAVFVGSAHYYAADERYLSVILFAAIIVVAVVGRQYSWQSKHLLLLGALLIVTSAFGVITASQTYASERSALARYDYRTASIVAAVRNHPTDVLVGDYWRVVPVKQRSAALAILPLANCTTPRTDLSSSAWQVDLHRHSFTYLLSYDQPLTDYPKCTLDQIVQTYGRPNSSAVIVGTPKHPIEQVLFYDRGAYRSAPASNTAQPETVVPVSLEELPYTSCQAPTIMAIVAHQDDDLLFMNPDLSRAIAAGDCVRTVYITAGDAGLGKYYWLSRQQGSEAAYSQMLGHQSEVWVERVVSLSETEYITVANPRGNTQISLIFFHLPDGDIHGTGFAANKHQSLARLMSHQVAKIQTEDRLSSFSADELVAALAKLMSTYSPTEVYAQSMTVGRKYPDHSDHTMTSIFTTKARQVYEATSLGDTIQIPIHYYAGYPIHEMPVNLTDVEAQLKTLTFLQYALHDGSVCHSLYICRKTGTYGSYLQRQYRFDY